MDIYNPKKVSSESIGNLTKLASCLDLTIEEIEEAQELPAAERYRVKETPKKNGSIRKVYSPHFLIRKIQRRINSRILSNPHMIAWPNHIFGSIPNQDVNEPFIAERYYINCARQHCGAKSILTLDIKDFFDNIHQSYVEGIFTTFLKFNRNVSKVLSDLCCLDGRVVQGALTSSYIASLCLWDIEGELVNKLGHKNLIYTRLVDDINVSSLVSNYEFTYATRAIETMLDKKGLPLNLEKTKTQYVSTTPLIVHGLRVSFKEPRLPSSEVRNIRAAVKNIEVLASERLYRISHAYRKDFNRCMGRVNKLHRVGHNQHRNLVNRLKKVIPLPSKKDIVRVTLIIERLEKDHADKKSTYWYRRRFYLAHERLNILQRLYCKVSGELRERLKKLVPTYGF